MRRSGVGGLLFGHDWSGYTSTPTLRRRFFTRRLLPCRIDSNRRVCKTKNSVSVLRPSSQRDSRRAVVAELADAHGSGPCTRKGVGVRVPPSAPNFQTIILLR